MPISHAALNARSTNQRNSFGGGYASNSYGKREAHKRFIFQVRVSCAVLVSYLVYHIVWAMWCFKAGLDPPGVFVLLTSHTILAIVIVPLILITLRVGWRSASTNTK